MENETVINKTKEVRELQKELIRLDSSDDKLFKDEYYKWMEVHKRTRLAEVELDAMLKAWDDDETVLDSARTDNSVDEFKAGRIANLYGK